MCVQAKFQLNLDPGSDLKKNGRKKEESMMSSFKPTCHGSSTNFYLIKKSEDVIQSSLKNATIYYNRLILGYLISHLNHWLSIVCGENYRI